MRKWDLEYNILIDIIANRHKHQCSFPCKSFVNILFDLFLSIPVNTTLFDDISKYCILSIIYEFLLYWKTNVIDWYKIIYLYLLLVVLEINFCVQFCHMWIETILFSFLLPICISFIFSFVLLLNCLGSQEQLKLTMFSWIHSRHFCIISSRKKLSIFYY